MKTAPTMVVRRKGEFVLCKIEPGGTTVVTLETRGPVKRGDRIELRPHEQNMARHLISFGVSAP